MFGIGFPELLLILIVALLVVGPSRLPQVARAIGKALGDFRRMADDVKETIEHELIRDEEKPDEPEVSREEPSDNKDAVAHHQPLPLPGTDASSHDQPVPPHERDAILHGESELPAGAQDPHARKGP